APSTDTPARDTLVPSDHSAGGHVKLTKSRAIGVAAMGIAGALAFALPGIAGHPATNTPYTDSQDCGDSNTVAFDGTTALWPPNHKFTTESITAHDGNSATPTDQTSLTVMDAKV